MSVFQVKLVRVVGAGYATDPSVAAGVSNQKTMVVTGPRLIQRRLVDGETFTSTNYWKRFCPISEGGTMAEADAFLHMVTDDGTVWSDVDPDLNRVARVHDLTVTAGTTFTDTGNEIDVLTLYGGTAVMVQITTDVAIKVRLNSDSLADFDLAAGSVTFDHSELPITSVAFDNSASGATNATVQVLVVVQLESDD